MGDIKAFLLPPVMEETKEAVITKRAKGPDGKPVPFVLRAIDQETNDKLIRRAQRTNKVNGQTVRELDTEKYGKLLISACVIEPNFKDAELCAYYKTVDPLDVPGKMLSSGEYAKLMQEINSLNGFEDIDGLEETAKN
jgi:hypothetical protein